MSEDWEFEETLRRLVGPVERSEVWAKIQARAGGDPWAIGDRGGAAAEDGAPTRPRKPNLRIALYVFLAVVVIAAMTVGSLEAIKHLGKDQSILVISDDPTGITPGSTGRDTQTSTSEPSAAMFGGNAARTGVYPGGGPTDQPELLWKFKTGGGEGSSPVVSDGVVYVGGGYEYLYALDAQSGEEKWKSPWSAYWGLAFCPTFSEGVVYIGSYGGGYLSALDAASGQEMWRFQTGDHIESSPAVSDGVVYFGSDDSHLYALEAVSGQLRWKFRAGDGEGYHAVSSSPAISEGVVYFGDTQGNLYALDAQTGQEMWSFGPGDVSGSWCWGSPAVSDGVVYFANVGPQHPYGAPSNYGYLHALDAQTGEEKWMYKADGVIRSSPAVSGGVVYFLYDVGELARWGVFSEGVLAVAVDATSGRELWQFPAANDSGWGVEIRSSPSISGEVVYFGTASEDGRLYALDATIGEELWTWVTSRGSGRYTASSSPAISGGVVYFSGNDGYLYALK